MRHWIFLLISGLLEVGWVVSLKSTHGFSRLIPMIGYVLFGFGAAFFLALSLKTIPMATAYAFWMGISVVGALVLDVALYKQPWSVFRTLCVLLIVLGTCGLRFAAP